MARHSIDRNEAVDLAHRLQPVVNSDPPSSGARFVTPGHLRSLSLLEDREASLETLDVFRSALGGIDVLLRPVDAGVTVMSLDGENCASMISVGATAGGGALTSLPPSPVEVAAMVRDYLDKRDGLQRASKEELFSLGLIADALSSELRLAATGWLYVAHEWRLHISNGSNGKADLIAFDPRTRRLIAIELKASADYAGKPDKNGWDAARQADEYADAIWRGRDQLYPFFERLIAAQVKLYGAEPFDGLELDRTSRPSTAVWWPDSAGDHTPAWPAWNAGELAVESDAPRLAHYRRHQSWWRESVRGVAPAAHPTVANRLIGSSFATAAVESDRRINFIDEAAYRHAERRAKEVEREGGTLDADRFVRKSAVVDADVLQPVRSNRNSPEIRRPGSSGVRLGRSGDRRRRMRGTDTRAVDGSNRLRLTGRLLNTSRREAVPRHRDEVHRALHPNAIRPGRIPSAD